MGLSRTEIELLIRARNEAQGAFDQLNRQVSAVTGNTDQASKGMEGLGKTTKTTGVAAQATAVAVGMLAEKLARGLVTSFQDTIASANKMDAAMGGLGAVAKGFNVNVSAAEQAAKDFAADGLTSVSEAATALKNLLSVGYGLEESIQIMKAHADAAAFNRQGMLGFGESIVRVTDGLKFNNSTLTDSTGLGKNLSSVMKDAGLSQDAFGNAVNDAGARTAYLNETLRAAAVFTDNASKYAKSAAGQQAAFAATTETAAAKIGKELQPALGAVLAVLGPFVQVAGEAAPVLVPLAAAVAGVVVPLAAMRIAASLGIPSLAGLTGEAVKMMGVFKGVKTLTDARAGIALVGEASGLTTKNLGALGSAAAVAGTAFAGWQLGRIIAQTFDLDQKVASLWNKLRGVNAELVDNEIKQSTINHALRNGAAATITYMQAVEYNMRVEAIRIAQFNKSAEVQQAAIKAELELGRITQQTANERMAGIEAEKRAQEVQKARVSLAASIRTAEKQVQDEIKATGMSMGDLLGALKQNEDAFKRWADQNKLSADTVKFLEDQVKKQEAAQKKSTETADKAAKKQEELKDALKSVGIVTKDMVLAELAELAELEKTATKEGVPLEAILKLLSPRLSELATSAKGSKVEVKELTAALERTTATIFKMPVALPFAKTNLDVLKFGQSVQMGNKDLMLANTAMKTLGLTSQAEMQRAAQAAEMAWRDIVRVYGEKSPEATAAYKAMIDKQKELTNGLPSFWRDEILPGITRTINTMGTAIEGSFAQMLLGAKSFKAGFQDIWESIKAGAVRIFNEILSSFINRFLKGMLAALHGEKNAFSSAFAGLLGGVGRGGGGAATSAAGGAASLFGGGGLVDLSTGTVGTSGGAAAAGGGMSTLAGSMLGVGAGALGGGLLGNRYGRTAGVLGGVASGVATGAMFGGPVGAIVGGAAGLISGLIAGGKNNTKDQRATFAKELGYDSIDDLFAALKEKAPDQAAELRNRALNQIGRKDNAGNAKWMEDVVAAMQKAEDKVNALAAATGRLGLTWEDMDKTVQQTTVSKIAQQMLDDQKLAEEQGYRHDAVIKKQAGSYSELIAKSKELGVDLPAAIKPVLQELIDMGLLVDANGEKITDLGSLTFAAAKTQTDAAKDASDKMQFYQKELTRLMAAEAEAQTEIERNKLRNQIADIERFLLEARRTAAGGVSVPVYWEYDGAAPGLTPGVIGGGGGGRPVEGAAAGGIMANRPGLVLFGEGGETEVGGPASFFRKIFGEMGMAGGGTGAIDNRIVVDGQTLARVITPYVVNYMRSLGLVP